MRLSTREFLLLLRWALLVAATIAGYFLGEGRWLLGLVFGVPWLGVSVALFCLIYPPRDGVTRGVVLDGLIKGALLGLLLATVHAWGGYYSTPLLSLAIPLVIVLIPLSQYVLVRCHYLHEGDLPLLVECVVLVALLAWPIEALVFVVANSRSYELRNLQDHGLALSAAGVFFTVIVAAFQAAISYVKATWLHQSVRSLVQEHVAKTRLTELQKHLHEELRDDRIVKVQCYHSTSLLFGFWLDPLKQAEKDISLLTYALHNCTGGPTDVELIGPSPTGLEYLITSRMFLLMEASTDDLLPKWQAFLEEVVADLDTRLDRVDQLLAVKHLRTHNSREWWTMLDGLRWYLLWKYYDCLQRFYKPFHIGADRQVSIRECTRYDDIIPQSLGPLFPSHSKASAPLPNQPAASAPVWHLDSLVHLRGKIGDLLDAMAQVDQVFFPEYAFAVLNPRAQDVKAGLRAKVLLCYNILGSLNFARFFSQPPSILRLMNDEFVEHYSQVFQNAMHSEANAPTAPITKPLTPGAILTLEQCRDRWRQLANHAWQSLEALVSGNGGRQKELGSHGTDHC